MNELEKAIRDFSKIDLNKVTLADHISLMMATQEFINTLNALVNKYGENPKVTRIIYED